MVCNILIMTSNGGVKKHLNTKSNKSNKKLMKILSADSRDRGDNMILTEDACQSMNNYTLNKKLNLTEIDTEVGEMLFPVELNKYLQEKVEILTEENGRLQRLLEESDAQLKALEIKCPPAVHGRASDLAASKIVELSKKIRELTAELEVTKLRARNAESQPQMPKKPIKVEVLQEEKENKSESILTTEIKELTEKMNSTNLKLCESRNQVQQLKHELKITQKALTDEVGQNIPLQNILSGKGWRGRAQQICGLQQRLNQLSEKLASHEQNSGVVSNDSISSIRQVEKEIRNELASELKESRKELEQIKSKWSAVKVRCRVLENDLSASKDKITTLLDKTSHDDQLINVLTSQLNTLNEKHKEEQQAILKKMEHNIISLENSLSLEKTRSTQLQSVLESREEHISELQEKVKSLLKRIDCDSGDKLSNLTNNNTASLSNNVTTTNEVTQDVLGQLAEAERLRLLELIQVLNKRLDVQRSNSMQTEEELRHERQKSAKLETKVARLELERVGAEKSSSTYSNRIPMTDTSVNDKAKEKIELLEERCAALKLRLQCVTQEKEDDLYHMTCLLDEAKKSYMEALRKNNAP